MSVEKIIERINKDLKAKIKHIEQREQKKAERETEKIRKEMERKLNEIERNREREIKIMYNRMVSQAKLKAKKKKLEVREQMMDKVFKEAKKEIAGTDPEKYREYLRKSIGKAVDVLGDEITIKCSEKSASIVKELTDKIAPSAEVESGLKTIGGIRAVSPVGAAIDLTFEANLERRKKELRKEISDILFEVDST